MQLLSELEKITPFPSHTHTHSYVVYPDNSIQLIGENTTTKTIDLAFHVKRPWNRRGTFDEYLIECKGDLGEVQVVSIRNEGPKAMNLIANWYLDFTNVINFQTMSELTFSFYHWIGEGDHFSNPADSSTINQIEHYPNLMKQRITQIEDRKKVYIWQTFPDIGLPSAIDENFYVPKDEEFEKAKIQDSKSNKFMGMVFGLRSDVTNIVKIKLSDLFDTTIRNDQPLRSLRRAEKVANSMMDANRWISDIEFGRQLLNGVNCVLVTLCTELPDNFPVKNEMVCNSLCRGLTLEEEMKDHNIYFCDLSEIMDGLQCKEGTHCAAPICLLYVTPANVTIPIAILLKRIPGDDNPIFLPSENWLDWLMAKMYFASASTQHQQVATHFVMCHTAMEAYGVATMRTLPDCHPVYKLLRPAFRYTISINVVGRKTLANPGGIMDKLFSIGGEDDRSGKNELIVRTNEKYNVHWSNIKRNLRERRVDNSDKLPNYYYRDDGVRIWDAMECFVRSMLGLFYTDDTEVENDSELRDWTNEIHSYAFPAFHGAIQGRGFPQQILTKNELVEYCTLIMFTGSVQHSAVNFGQLQMYGFVLNSPTTIRVPLPTQKGSFMKNDILRALPTMTTVVLAAITVNTLSYHSIDEVNNDNHSVVKCSLHEHGYKKTIVVCS
ncbi:Arachidonate 5-lipoxygenase-like [Oopsacas minuta]|uniref:Arachidonate 5-lipoxygenase-like n=1 Tax=Oopsacas minuta TaxID=111878 RepID=A0AAV7JWY4_9METZ|nr:Arachidonate 5-lipoxygenase-like [Oopsacas minuta]